MSSRIESGNTKHGRSAQWSSAAGHLNHIFALPFLPERANTAISGTVQVTHVLFIPPSAVAKISIHPPKRL